MSQFDLNLAVQEFTHNVQLTAQQKTSRLQSAVMTGNHTGEKAAIVDQYLPIEAIEVTSRYTPIVPQDIQNDRRWVSPRDFRIADWVDKFDELRLLNDPKSHYVTDTVAGLNRRIDRTIIEGIFNDNLTGKSGTTATSFPSSQQIAANFATTTTLTVAKLIEGLRILEENEVDIEGEPVFCIISAKQHANLLNEIQVVNSDYNSTKVLTNGKVTSFLGINFIRSQLLPVDGSSYRRVPLFVKSGVHYGEFGGGIKVDVRERADLEGLPWQVYARITHGATRTEEKKVVEIKCAE
jgi:hypothetical protein